MVLFVYQAVKIDASEVTVWYKMGTVAKKLHNYPLARLAFEQVCSSPVTSQHNSHLSHNSPVTSLHSHNSPLS